MNNNSGDRRQTFAAMLEAAINHPDAPKQVDIARKLGYNNANVLTMFKRGTTRVPLDKVVTLAQVLGGDPSEWIKLWFDAYEPDCYEQMERYIGLGLTSQEKSWIKGLRKLFGRHTVPSFNASFVNAHSTETRAA